MVTAPLKPFVQHMGLFFLLKNRLKITLQKLCLCSLSRLALPFTVCVSAEAVVVPAEVFFFGCVWFWCFFFFFFTKLMSS